MKKEINVPLYLHIDTWKEGWGDIVKITGMGLLLYNISLCSFTRFPETIRRGADAASGISCAYDINAKLKDININLKLFHP